MSLILLILSVVEQPVCLRSLFFFMHHIHLQRIQNFLLYQWLQPIPARCRKTDTLLCSLHRALPSDRRCCSASVFVFHLLTAKRSSGQIHWAIVEFAWSPLVCMVWHLALWLTYQACYVNWLIVCLSMLVLRLAQDVP